MQLKQATRWSWDNQIFTHDGVDTTVHCNSFLRDGPADSIRRFTERLSRAVADIVRGSAAMFRGGECGLVRGDRAGAGSAGAGSGVAGSLLYSVPEKHRLGGEALGQDGLVRESRALKRGQVIHGHRGGAWRGGDVAEDARGVCL